MKKILGLLLIFFVFVILDLCLVEDSNALCGAYAAPDVWKEVDCYNLAAIGKTTGDDPFTPSWRLIGGYWQWGRKGPDASQWYNTNTVNFAHGPVGPDARSANSGMISGWDQTDIPDYSWSDSYKTANDPCPDGYRVPTGIQWDGFRNNNTRSITGTWAGSATNYSSALFLGNDLMLPAAGYRLTFSSSGSLGNRGFYGYYWSSSQATYYNAWHLAFGSDTTDTYSIGRSYGFSVRCVADESTACTYSISPSSIRFAADGGTDSVAITASGSSCAWTTVNNLSWVNLSPSSGTGSQNITVSVTANTGEARTGSVTIAGQIYTISQGYQTAEKPGLLSPSDGAPGVSLTPVLTTDSFSGTVPGITHLKTGWQISTGQYFSLLVLDQESAVHLTSLVVPAMILEENTTYYWRVRFFDNQFNVSDWSDVFSFTTLQTFTDINNNGIPDALENYTADLDNDGIPDSQQTDTIKTFNTMVGSGQMGVSIKDSETIIELTSVNAIDPDTISTYARPHTMPLGMISYRVKVADPGDTARVKVYFSDPAPVNASWFFHDTITGWTDYSRHVTFSDDRMSAVVELKDGDYGDADGIANGIIVDPSGFGIGSWLSGTITDAADLQGISNAVISFPDINLSLNTLADGQYLTLLLPGIYDMTVSASGYQSKTMTGIKISEADIVTQSFELSGRTRILGFTTTGTPSTLTSVNYTINAQSGSPTISYRYSIRSGYGTPAYDTNPWTSMTSTEYQTSSSCNYTFGSSNKSIVVVWATASNTSSVDPAGIPIIGWSVDTSGAACSTHFTGVSITGDQKVNENITFAVTAQNSCSQTLYYRFSMHPDYGTAGYDGTRWQSMTGSEWITDNFTDYTFTRAGKYIIVVWVTDDPYTQDPAGIPIIGWSVDIEQRVL